MTSSLDWNIQVDEICLKANRKLSVLYKLTVTSVIDYALPVYYKSLRQTEYARLENIQYRAAKIVTGALHLSNREI